MNFKKVSRPFTTCRSEPELDLNTAQIKACFSNLMTSFAASSLATAFQLTYTKSHPCCVDPAFVKATICLMRLY